MPWNSEICNKLFDGNIRIFCSSALTFRFLAGDYLFLQVLHKIKTVRRSYGVDQDRLFLFDQVSVLAGAVHDGIVIPMEAFQFPVNLADPADISFYMLSHVSPPQKHFSFRSFLHRSILPQR